MKARSITFDNGLMVMPFIVLIFFIMSSLAQAAVESNVRATKHNLSASSGNTVQATTESQVCVFCHTPHAATAEAAPLWNRQLSPSATYAMYDSLSLDATDVANAPGGSSKLCLSCHDGTVAIGSVNVSNGQANPVFAMNGTAGGKMPIGAGVTTGFTRHLGQDLTNDHPISFTYDTTLATTDGELRDPATTAHLGDNLPGDHPTIPLQNGKVQCTSCHDPHLFDSSDPNRKFLRANRTQQTTPIDGAFNEAEDIICLACHFKDKVSDAWALSVHANSTDANETYTEAARTLREFPDTPGGFKVWQASCLNCHDTHTVQGSRRLLREGVDGAVDGTTGVKLGGISTNPAIEETCYQCHQTAATGILIDDINNKVPNIKSDFTDAGSKHMPITWDEQQQKISGEETHEITDADFSESKEKIGYDGTVNSDNRHVECTDCHNPHRVMKAAKFNATASEASGTHNHAAGHTNIASGALKGSFGVEPNYNGNTAFNADHDDIENNNRITYDVKKGVPDASEAVSSTYVTREYQVCLRCHSNYGFGSTPPTLGASGGGTTNDTNGVDQLTNQAMEFQAPLADKGEPGGNHRSWHPVMAETGRTSTVRGSNDNSWLAPWNGGVGTQTMYCSDCHGNSTVLGTSTPAAGKPWGPHGSQNNFVLKGPWSPPTTGAIGADILCFRCHDSNVYDGGTSNDGDTGFCCGKGNLHEYHTDKAGANYRCNACHVALPHGWKNKALLVNLNDIDPNELAPDSTQTLPFTGKILSDGPYYQGATLRILNWAKSSEWSEDDCGEDNGNKGKGWMQSVCDG